MRMTLFVIALVALLACGMAAAGRAPKSGIQGVAVAGPIMPVERPGVKNTRPLAGAIITVQPAGGGREIARQAADAQGRFVIALPPGKYRVVPLPPGAYIHMHNVYLQYAAERGVPALLAFLWWMGKMLSDLLRVPQKDWVVRGAVAVMFAVLAAGWYEHNLGNGDVLPLFLGVCVCGYVAAGEDHCIGTRNGIH